MPIIPNGIPSYKIRAPCTMGDSGLPSLSLMNDVQRVLLFIHDERHLTAHTLYCNILHRIQEYDDRNQIKITTTTTTNTTKKKKSSSSLTSFWKTKQPQQRGNTTKNNTNTKSTSNHNDDDNDDDDRIMIQQIKDLIFVTHKDVLDTLQKRCQLFRTAQENFSTTTYNNTNNDLLPAQNGNGGLSTNDDSRPTTEINHKQNANTTTTATTTTNDWIYASKHFGITTYYRREVSDQSLSIKLEGTIDSAALFEQICVLKEVDLHYLWSPFCTSSMTIANLDKLDLVGWFVIGLPNFGLARDGCYRAIGCDNIEEDGSIILTGRGLFDQPSPITTPPTDTTTNTTSNNHNDNNHIGSSSSTMTSESIPIDSFLSSDPILQKLDIPPVPTRMGSGRMTIRKFDAIIHITSPTSVRTQLIANMNPNISFLPNTLLEFGMKHLASVVLSKLQSAAKKATLHPVTNLHAIKMREEKEFYETWLLAKFRGVCAQRGWDMPTVAALNLSESDLQKAQRHAIQSHKKDIYGYNRAQTFCVNDDANDDDDDDRHPQHHNVDSPPNHDETDANSDIVSALSTDTGRMSVWSNNPLSAYLRETERKVQQKKADVEAESRQRAMERLQPKDRSYTDEERLAELKLAKYRRLDISGTTTTATATTTTTASTTNLNAASGVMTTSKSYSQRLAYQLYNHPPRTRYCVVLILVCILLGMLYAGVIVQTSKIISTHPTMPWYMNRLKDLGIVVYIFVCTIPHCLLVYVSLIYAFESLDIGSKSGRQAKTYYSDHVNSLSIIASFGMAAISIALAISKVLVRTMIWSSVKLWVLFGVYLLAPVQKVLNDSMQLLSSDTVTECSTVIMSGVAALKYAMQTCIWFVTVVIGLIWRYFLESNFIGKGIASVIMTGISVGVKAIKGTKEFVECSIKSFDGEVTITSWRVEAFTTARFLFMNTAVFLLVTLTLFYLSSRKPSPSATVKNSQANGKESKADGSDDSNSPIPDAPLQFNKYATIPEEGTVDVMDSHAFNPVDHASTDDVVVGTKRRRFRFRQGRAVSTPDVSSNTTGRKHISKISSSPNINSVDHTGRKHASKDRNKRLTHMKTM